MLQIAFRYNGVIQGLFVFEDGVHEQGIQGVGDEFHGGFRMNLAGIGIDLVVSILDQGYVKSGGLCRCEFGTVEAMCYEEAKFALTASYGPNFMTPIPRVMALLNQAIPEFTLAYSGPTPEAEAGRARRRQHTHAQHEN